MEYVRFGELYKTPSCNGLSRPRAVRGEGYKMVNMGELFSNNIINDIYMERVQMNERELKKFLLKKGDLLFARQSLVASGAGKCSIVNNIVEDTTFESHLIRVRLDESKANPLYYYYLFQLPYNPVKTIVNQCAQAGIRGTELIRVKVPFPTMKEQNRIANALFQYDDLIENNNKRIKLLEQMAENLYKEWFVRFRFPGYEDVEFENGIPKGWEEVRAGEFINLKSGYAFKSDWWTDEGVPVIKIKDIQDGKIDLTTLDYVSEENAQKAKKFYVGKGDILIALTGATIGKVGIVTRDNILVNQRVGKFFIEKPSIKNIGYIYNLFKQNWIQELIVMYSGSNAAQPNISPFDIEKFRIIYNKVYVDKFNVTVYPIYDSIIKLYEKNDVLIKQRDLLLPRLMSGKLEV